MKTNGLFYLSVLTQSYLLVETISRLAISTAAVDTSCDQLMRTVALRAGVLSVPRFSRFWIKEEIETLCENAGFEVELPGFRPDDRYRSFLGESGALGFLLRKTTPACDRAARWHQGNIDGDLQQRLFRAGAYDTIVAAWDAAPAHLANDQTCTLNFVLAAICCSGRSGEIVLSAITPGNKEFCERSVTYAEVLKSGNYKEAIALSRNLPGHRERSAVLQYLAGEDVILTGQSPSTDLAVALAGSARRRDDRETAKLARRLVDTARDENRIPPSLDAALPGNFSLNHPELSANADFRTVAYLRLMQDIDAREAALATSEP